MCGCWSRRGEQHLALESLHADAGRELGREHLHHDVASERGLEGDEGARHPAATELPLERVGGTE